jgi:hypothetical protein
MRKNIWLIALTIALAGAMSAQFNRGTVVGTVTDETGSVIPGARVTLKNVGTGEERMVKSDARGDYAFPSLLPGAYDAQVEMQGFKTEVVKSIQLQVSQTARIDVKLAVGEVVQRVEATASLALMKTDTSDIGGVINNKQIVDLPMNGRDYLQLARLMPGMIPSRAGATAGQKGVSRSVNAAGARDTSVSFLLDGIDTNDMAFQTPSVTPSVDAIQEFKVLANSYSAEFGRGSTQIITALKGGTNDWHGALFEFNRTNSLAARSFFQPGSVARLTQNQFGATFGGPIRVPKLYNGKDKTFFFLNYEGQGRRTGGAGFAFVPSPAYKSGDFSAPGSPRIYDPTTFDATARTRLQFPNNQIPASRIAPASNKITALWPEANYAGQVGRNYAKTIPGINDNDQGNARIDHRFSDKDSIFGRFSILNQFVPHYATLPLSGTVDDIRGQNVALNWVHVFSPTLLNEVRAGFNRAKYFTVPDGSVGANPSRDVFGFKNTTTDPTVAFGLPLFSFSGAFTDIGPGGQFPANSVTQTYQYVDNVTSIHGAHTLKTGFDLRRSRLTAITGVTGRGSLTFTGQFTNQPGASGTGNSLADLLLGFPQTAQAASGDGVAHNYVNMYAFYFQDDWKITPKLTLNLGVRYEYVTPYREKLDRFTIVDFNDTSGGRLLIANSTKAFLPGVGIVDSGGPITSRSLIPPDKNNFAPRVGFAYRAISRTVLRGGFGFFYDLQEGNEAQFLRQNPPFLFPINVTSDPLVPSLRLDQMFPSAASSPVGSLQPFTMDPKSRIPYVTQWNLAIEREILPNLLLEVGYVGSAGKKLLRRSNYQQQGPNILVTDTANPKALKDRVLYPNFSLNNILGTDNGGSSTYHGLLTRLERRFSNGVAFLVSYSFSRAISDSHSSSNFDNTPSNPQCRCDMRAEKSLAAFDIRHRMVFSYGYELPFGKGKHFANKGGFVNLIAGGWQINGITSLQTGPPFTLSTPGDNASIGSSAQRPNLVGDPYAGIDTSAPIEKRGVDAGTYYFNRAAYALPPLFRLGNTGKNTLIGPGSQTWDFSLFKNTAITEKINTQLRGEFFNVLNHANFAVPGRTLNTPAFGVITAINPASSGRVIQLALKLIF